jgi:hypothetical protein
MRRPLLKDLSLDLDSGENSSSSRCSTKNSDADVNWSLRALCMVLFVALLGSMIYCMRLSDLNQSYVKVGGNVWCFLLTLYCKQHCDEITVSVDPVEYCGSIRGQPGVCWAAHGGA